MANIFKRLSDVLAANLHELIDRVEDPERMAKQIIREMEDNLHIAEEGVIDAITSEKQLRHDLEHQRQQSMLWRQRAEEALRAEQDDLAREALQRKREYDQVARTLEPAWEAAQHTSGQLKAQLHALENKLDEAKRKRSTLAARQRAVEARSYLDQTMSGLQAGFDASANFTRMEDRVAEMEARLAAKAELRRDNTQLERTFEERQVAKEVDTELAALRQKLLAEPQEE